METVGYARLSRDKDGDGLAVERQTEDMRAKALALGWEPLGSVYTDNDVTADPRKAVRPAFQQLLADMAAGKVKRVLCYDQDRLVRDPRELEDIADAVVAGGVEFTSCNGDIDLRSDNGQMIARIKAAVARNELDKIARRTARQKQQRVEQGKPLGQRFRTFGYTRAWETVAAEAEIVREVYRRFIAGESQNAITGDLRARGIKTAAGSEWTPLQTSRMLKTPKYAGFQTYKGNIVGKSTVVEALVSEAEYEAAQKPRKGGIGTNFRKYLLSGILVCDTCKHTMTGFRDTANDTMRYRCEVRSGGCGNVSIKGEWVESMVNRYMSYWVANAYLRKQQEPKPQGPDNAVAIRAIDERITKLQADLGGPDLAYEDGIAALKAARAEKGRLVREDAAKVVAEVDYRHAITDYDAATDDQKRVEIRKAFRFIFVSPGKRVRYFDETRISALMTFRDDVVPGGAINVVDYRDELGEGTRADGPFDGSVGF